MVRYSEWVDVADRTVTWDPAVPGARAAALGAWWRVGLNTSGMGEDDWASRAATLDVPDEALSRKVPELIPVPPLLPPAGLPPGSIYGFENANSAGPGSMQRVLTTGSQLPEDFVGVLDWGCMAVGVTPQWTRPDMGWPEPPPGAVLETESEIEPLDVTVRFMGLIPTPTEGEAASIDYWEPPPSSQWPSSRTGWPSRQLFRAPDSGWRLITTRASDESLTVTVPVAGDGRAYFAASPTWVRGDTPPPDQGWRQNTFVALDRVVSGTARVSGRYRFRWDTAGQYRLRQRQSRVGSDSWPLRQRQNGGHSGSWPLRQRQTGV